MTARHHLPIFFWAFFLCAFNHAGLLAQNDSLTDHRKVDFFLLPAGSYSSDFGLHYGIYGNTFIYGPWMYPEYKHSIYYEASRYTNGQSLILTQYDSRYFIKDHRFTAAFIWQYDPMYYFYGFNGEAERYDNNLDKRNHNAIYNAFRRNIMATAKIQGKIRDSIYYIFGLNYTNYQFDHFSSKKYDNDTTLYRYYHDIGLIHDDEFHGGNRFEIEAGIAYDDRDKLIAPTHGKNATLYFEVSPDFFDEGYRYIKLCAHFSHFMKLTRTDRLVFAYHVAYQGTIAGKAPFFVQQNIYTLYLNQTGSEGLGGLNTLRGLPPNRMIGDGYLWGNVELRLKLFGFHLLKRDWYVGINPFADIGLIANPYRLDEMASATGRSESDLRHDAMLPQACIGMGFKLAMNENSIFSVEIAKNIANPTSYPVTVNIGLNYIF